MPGRKFTSATNYRYGFNGKEEDDEVKRDGNSLDFDARIYDSRLGRWLSVDPLTKKYPSENPYLYTGGNPILYVDKDGRDKILYFQVINLDGTVITVATKRTINNNVRLHIDKAYAGWDFYATDVKQIITYDMRTGQLSISGEESDYSHRRSSYMEGVNMKLGLHNRPNGKQAGGWVLTSEFASLGQGPQTKATKEENLNPINLDRLLAMMGAVSKQATPPDIDGMTPAEFSNTIKELTETIKDASPDKSDNESTKPADIIQKKERPARWFWSTEYGGASEAPRKDTLKKKGATTGAPDTLIITEITPSPNPSKKKKN